MQHFEDLPNCFPKRVHHLTFLPTMYEGSDFSICLPTLGLTVFSVVLFLASSPKQLGRIWGWGRHSPGHRESQGLTLGPTGLSLPGTTSLPGRGYVLGDRQGKQG